MLLLVAGCVARPPASRTPEPESRIEAQAPTPAPAPYEVIRSAPEVVESTPADPVRVEPTRPPAPVSPRDAAASGLVQALARQFGIQPDAVSVLGTEPSDWPDSCLGLPAEGEICGTVITPGFAVSLGVAGQRYDYRTDLSGQRVRLAAAPSPELGETQLVWRDSGSFGLLVVGTRQIAIGRRGRPMLGVPVPSAARAAELAGFLSAYAPAQGLTAAGEVVFRGTGGAPASGAELRRIAEWARELSQEIAGGVAPAVQNPVLVWRRRGGAIAANCSTLVVTRSGTVMKLDCTTEVAETRARVPLSAADLVTLYAWLDRLAPFTWQPQNPGSPANPEENSTSLEFTGDGSEEASPAERAQMLEFVARMTLTGET
jgi:hypothetical protein